MAETMLDILHAERFCVLCTCSHEEPHCSLMSYALSEDSREIYLVTNGQTRKFRNLEINPRVSLLVDTRIRTCEGDPSPTQALTVAGEYRAPANLSEEESVRERLLSRHPHLREFADSPDARFLCIRLRSFLLLQGLREARYEELD